MRRTCCLALRGRGTSSGPASGYFRLPGSNLPSCMQVHLDLISDVCSENIQEHNVGDLRRDARRRPELYSPNGAGLAVRIDLQSNQRLAQSNRVSGREFAWAKFHGDRVRPSKSQRGSAGCSNDERFRVETPKPLQGALDGQHLRRWVDRSTAGCACVQAEDLRFAAFRTPISPGVRA